MKLIISFAIANADVAAGEGALTTLYIPLFLSIKKSSNNSPSMVNI